MSQSILQAVSLTFIYPAPTEVKWMSWSLYRIYTGGKGRQSEAKLIKWCVIICTGINYFIRHKTSRY